MLPDYDLYNMPDYEDIAKNLHTELFKRNNRLEAAEQLLRKIRAELMAFKLDNWRTELINEINIVLGE